MTTYTLCQKVIQTGNYERKEMLEKMDVFLLNDRITQNEYTELMKLMA